jgi:hypothetical protein
VSPELITAAVIIGPGALTAAALGTAAGTATIRQRPTDRARARLLAELRAARATGPDEDPTPPDGGQPTPAPAEQPTGPVMRLAPVIPLPTGRPAAPHRVRRAA